jgi:K+-sensing histidine kinase KdpD
MLMKIIRKADQFIITIPKGLFDINEIQELLDLLRYRSLVSESKASEEQVQEVVDEISERLARRKDESAKRQV